jgi:hypothetical protein
MISISNFPTALSDGVWWLLVTKLWLELENGVSN